MGGGASSDLERARWNGPEPTAVAPPPAPTAQVYVTDSEWFITDRLNEIVEKHPAVTIGSYPEWTHNYFKVTN